MPVSKGIDVQKSRFAVLALETSSESDDDGVGNWETVKKTAHKPGDAKQAPKKGGELLGGENKPQSKSAKKRARKRKQQQAQVANETATSGNDVSNLPEAEPLLWQKKNEEVVEHEYQKDLEQAILLSKLESERHEMVVQQIQAADHLMKATKSSKKGVTMSLQQLHTTKVSAPTDSLCHFSDSEDSPVDPHFFSRLGQDVKTELKKEKKLEKHSDEGQPQSPTYTADDLPRIAQLQNEIEKRDKTIQHLKKDNDHLKKGLKEVKERNQSLCLIMSQGEISSKAKLLQQIEQLTTVKNELTVEVESLHTSLEQERSRNKILKSELTKLQGMKGAK